MIDRREHPALTERRRQVDGSALRQPLDGRLQALSIGDRAPRKLVGRGHSANQPGRAAIVNRRHPPLTLMDKLNQSQRHIVTPANRRLLPGLFRAP